MATKTTTVVNPNLPTPTWVNWVFRISLYLGTFAIFVVSTDDSIPADLSLQINKYISIAIVGIHGAGRLLGVSTREIADEAKDAFKP